MQRLSLAVVAADARRTPAAASAAWLACAPKRRTMLPRATTPWPPPRPPGLSARAGRLEMLSERRCTSR